MKSCCHNGYQKNISKKIKRLFLDSDYRFQVLATRGFYNHMDDRKYLKKTFKYIMEYELDLDNPKTFNEKIQWLKLYDRKPRYTMMVDKYEVRKYIADKIGKEYLIPLLGVWDTPDEIDFNLLPNQFVLKCNHNSGLGMCICKDKATLNITKVKKELRKGLKQDFYLTGREWPYKNVNRRIIAEKYMENEVTHELMDYKFFCFNGQVEFFKIDFNRFINHQANYYSIDGALLPFGEQVCPPDFEKKLLMPFNLKKMIELAGVLSKGIPFIRVDFYEVQKRVYFGELTFYPASGMGKFIPNEIDMQLGKKINILKQS